MVPIAAQARWRHHVQSQAFLGRPVRRCSLHPERALCQQSQSAPEEFRSLRWVHNIAPWSNDGYRITPRDGHQVEVSLRQSKLPREKQEP
jgi:hypothetical protein